MKLLDSALSHAKSAYLWAVVGDAAHPYTTFYFTEDRSRAGPEQLLQSFAGILVSDAYVCYESLQSEWSAGKRWACCHAHAPTTNAEPPAAPVPGRASRRREYTAH